MNKKNKHRVPIDLIARILSGEADSSEQSRLELWLSESENNRKTFSQFTALWEKSGAIVPTDNIDLEDEWNTFRSQSNDRGDLKEPKSLTFQLRRIVAAAVIGLLIVISSTITYNSIKFEKVVAEAELSNIILPDGSSATLYPGTEIRYPKKFSQDSRKIDLDGEAFFSVVRDTLRSFSVNSGNMVVKVLGTSFNVEAFKASDTFNVIVEEGKVAVFHEKREANSEQLEPGDKATFIRGSNEIIKSVNNDFNYNAWKTKRIVFENTDLQEMTSTLSKVFMREITTPENSNELRITVIFENRSLDYILNTIEATLDVTVSEEDGIITVK